jgi:hypothetical protein
MTPRPRLYGLLAEFADPESLVKATNKAYEAGYRKMDAFSPFPIEELTEALRIKSTRLPFVVLLGGLIGGLGGYLLQWWASVVYYPLVIAGKPLHSWPMFIPVTFELTVLGASLAAVLGMLAFNGLPMPHHPLFDVERFAMASRDRFFLCIQSLDAQFDEVKTKEFLEGLKPSQPVAEVEL